MLPWFSIGSRHFVGCFLTSNYWKSCDFLLLPTPAGWESAAIKEIFVPVERGSSGSWKAEFEVYSDRANCVMSWSMPTNFPSFPCDTGRECWSKLSQKLRPDWPWILTVVVGLIPMSRWRWEEVIRNSLRRHPRNCLTSGELNMHRSRSSSCQSGPTHYGAWGGNGCWTCTGIPPANHMA